jgi:hypothetical protein
MSERERYRDALKPPAWTTSKQRSSVDDIYTELDWLKTYLVEKDIWDSACWAHYTRLRSLCATHIPKPAPMFVCSACGMECRSSAGLFEHLDVVHWIKGAA